MSTAVIDPYRLATSLKATGKNSNFTADELANAFDASQLGFDVLTKSEFDASMARFAADFDAKIAGLDAKIDGRIAGLDAKIDLVRADIRVEVRAMQVQTLMWLGGIMLVSNGAVITLLARTARLF